MHVPVIVNPSIHVCLRNPLDHLHSCPRRTQSEPPKHSIACAKSLSDGSRTAWTVYVPFRYRNMYPTPTRAPRFLRIFARRQHSSSGPLLTGFSTKRAHPVKEDTSCCSRFLPGTSLPRANGGAPTTVILSRPWEVNREPSVRGDQTHTYRGIFS